MLYVVSFGFKTPLVQAGMRRGNVERRGGKEKGDMRMWTVEKVRVERRWD